METAEAKWIGKLGFVAKTGSNHRVVMDTNTEFGGEDAGVRPMELFLAGLAGCTGMDVVSILKKMRVDFRAFTIEVEADRAEDHPKVYQKIRLNYIVEGDDIPEDKLKRAIELSQDRYCSASAMLKNSAEITYSYKIASPENR